MSTAHKSDRRNRKKGRLSQKRMSFEEITTKLNEPLSITAELAKLPFAIKALLGSIVCSLILSILLTYEQITIEQDPMSNQISFVFPSTDY